MKNNISFNSKLSKFGIGLFETIKIENEPIDFDLHMNRLYNSVRDLNIKIDIDKSTLKDKEKILTKKVLKKEVNDSTMVVEVFVVVLENIAQTQEFTKGE